MQPPSATEPTAPSLSSSLSPSLRATPAGGSVSSAAAYEIKFLLTEDRARDVEARLLECLLPDPHSDPALGGMYAITSLACDAADFPVFFRDERVDSCKFRIRRYGDSPALYFERKRSRKGKVRKQRSQGGPADLLALKADGPTAEQATGQAALTLTEAAHAWFVHDLRRLDLSPRVLIRCLRRALFGVCDEGAMRVTFDRSVRGCLASGWSLEPGSDLRPLLDGLVVCEFKFTEAMPSPLKKIVADMALQPTGISKYRTCVRAFARELGVDIAREGAGAVHA